MLRSALATRRIRNDGRSATSVATGVAAALVDEHDLGGERRAGGDGAQTGAQQLRPPDRRDDEADRAGGRLTSALRRADRPPQQRTNGRTQAVVRIARGRADAEAQRFLLLVPVVTGVHVDADQVLVGTQQRRTSILRSYVP